MDKYDWFEKTGYTPHAEQREFHDSDARFRLFVAGRRWGMTLALTKEAEVMLMEPGTKGWVVADTLDMVEAIMSAMHSNLEMRVPPPWNVNRPLEYPWGSTVEGKIGQRPETMLGVDDVDWIVFDNCAYSDKRVFELCRNALKQPRTVVVKQRWHRRLIHRILPFWCKPKTESLPGGKMVMATTPQGTMNWVYHLFSSIRSAECSGSIEYKDWWAGSYCTYPNTPEDIELMQRSMTTNQYRQEVLGQFVEADPCPIGYTRHEPFSKGKLIIMDDSENTDKLEENDDTTQKD